MLNQGWVYGDRPQARHVGLTVLDFYAQNYRHSTREQWLNRILQGQILLDGKLAEPDQLLQKNQKLEYHREPWNEPDVPLNFEILHQDEHFWIIDKPSGLPVMPAGNFLEHTLLHQLKKQFPKETLYPIHRLGRGTSGLMILGRSPLGRKNLAKQLREHQITKIYQTIIPAGNYPDELVINQPIGKVPHPILGTIFGATPDGKYAHSEMKVLQRYADKSLVQVKILTGRPHQIRIHLAAIAYPLIGDPLYDVGGIPKIPADPQQTALPGDLGYYLRATELHFKHPETLKEQHFYGGEKHLDFLN